MSLFNFLDCRRIRRLDEKDVFHLDHKVKPPKCANCKTRKNVHLDWVGGNIAYYSMKYYVRRWLRQVQRTLPQTWFGNVGLLVILFAYLGLVFYNMKLTVDLIEK